MTPGDKSYIGDNEGHAISKLEGFEEDSRDGVKGTDLKVWQ